MNYGFAHDGTVYGPSGKLPISPAEVDSYNRDLESQELAHILSGQASHLFLYVHYVPTTWTKEMWPSVISPARWELRTWLGTPVVANCLVGLRKPGGFGSYRRHVRARIGGTLYHGWYCESSGDYCRLRKAKSQKA